MSLETMILAVLVFDTTITIVLATTFKAFYDAYHSEE